jgi:hypothetical protein
MASFELHMMAKRLGSELKVANPKNRYWQNMLNLERMTVKCSMMLFEILDLFFCN